MAMLITWLTGSTAKRLIRLPPFRMGSLPAHRGRPPWQILALALLLAGCAGALDKSEDFDRHRFSQLVQPLGRPGSIFFDVIFSAAYPVNDPVADARRTAWLGGWLAQKRLCAGGYEVVIRRPFDYLEDNPAGFQQRWEIRCRAVPGN